MNHISYFEIQADDQERAIDFYASIFGWKFERASEITYEIYYRIEGSGIMGGLLKRPAERLPRGHGANAFCCSIQVENFDTTSENIIAHGGMIAHPKFTIPGKCYQGYFLDSEKNLFGIFEVDESAK